MTIPVGEPHWQYDIVTHYLGNVNFTSSVRLPRFPHKHLVVIAGLVLGGSINVTVKNEPPVQVHHNPSPVSI